MLFGTSFASPLPKLLFLPAISSTSFEYLSNMLLLQADTLQRHLNFPLLLEVYLSKYSLCIECIVLWQVLILRSIPVCSQISEKLQDTAKALKLYEIL